MSHLLETLPRPAIIAHRGASLYAPENTLAAFQLAVEQGADGVELDVRLSADGHLVVIHDASVKSTTNGRGWVSNMTLTGLRKLHAGSDRPPARAGHGIPTLDEVFESLGKKLLINVELKPLHQDTKILAEKVAQAIQRHQLQQVVICSSFKPSALKALAQVDPMIARGLLFPAGAIPRNLSKWASKAFGGSITYQSLHPHYHDVLKGSFLPMNDGKHRLPIFTYTVNEKGDMERLFRSGIDGVFTDDPLLAHQVRGY